jgi:hypothetical protein
MNAEISFDLCMEDDMSFAEGAYRLPGGSWHVFIFSRKDVDSVRILDTDWESGAEGFVVHFPRSQRLNKSAVERVLSERLGVTEWIEVRGPDSMHLR